MFRLLNESKLLDSLLFLDWLLAVQPHLRSLVVQQQQLKARILMGIRALYQAPRIQDEYPLEENRKILEKLRKDVQKKLRLRTMSWHFS